LLSGCGVELGGEETVDRPEVLALSSETLSFGDTLEIYGGNFVQSDAEHTDLRFQGMFTPPSGVASAVDTRVRPHWVDGNQVVWAPVGPFTNPFTGGNEIGTFDGDVRAINVDGAGAEIPSKPLRIRLTFEGSIAIRKLAPTRAECAEPVKRLLGGFPYDITVEAVGFTPKSFTYAIAGEPLFPQGRVYRRGATGSSHSFRFVVAPVPDDVAFQLIVLSVSSLGTDGRQRMNSMVFGVHRPIEYVDSGTFKTAEVLAALPDSGCISGGPTGRTVTYVESHTDIRSRTVGINWSEAWSESSTTTKTLAHTVSNGITITNNGSTTNSSTYGWNSSTTAHVNVGSEVGGELGVPGVGSITGKVMTEVGIAHTFGRFGSHTTAYTQGWSVGRTQSTSDTESWAFSRSRGHSLSKGASDFWTVSSADSKSLAFSGQVLPGQFGVFYRQPVRIALPGALIAYNLCSDPSVVAQTNFFDYTWSVDLAIGNSCTPFPKSSLPDPQCHITPCEN
jgi:hypothetical protein